MLCDVMWLSLSLETDLCSFHSSGLDSRADMDGGGGEGGGGGKAAPPFQEAEKIIFPYISVCT